MISLTRTFVHLVDERNTAPRPMLCLEAAQRGPSSFGDAKLPANVCNMVTVYLDDMQLADPGAFLRGARLSTFARVEWLSALAATTRYGLQTRNTGVLLLYTKSGKQN